MTQQRENILMMRSLHLYKSSQLHPDMYGRHRIVTYLMFIAKFFICRHWGSVLVECGKILAVSGFKVKTRGPNGPVNAHLSLLHIPINMFEYYGI